MAYGPSGGAGLPSSPPVTNRPAPVGKLAPRPGGSRPGRSGQAGRGRALGRFSNPLYQPGQPLSGRGLLQAARALANAQINPVIKQLADQLTTQNQREGQSEKDISGYYQGLGQYAQQGNQQLGQINSDLNSTLGGIAGQENQALQQIGQGADQSLAKYTPGDASLSAPAFQALTQEIARQQGLAAQNEGTYRSFGAAQGANYRGLGAADLGAFATRGEETLGQVASANRLADEPINSKIAALEQQRGALIGADLGKLRQQEVANRFTGAALGQKQQALKQTAAYNQGRLANQQRGQNITAQNDLANQMLHQAALAEKTHNDAATQVYRQAALNLRRTQAGQSAKPFTTHENATWFAQLGQAEALIHDGQSNGQSEAQIRQHLQDGQNPSKRTFDGVMIQAAYELNGWGHITPATARLMHRMGLRGGSYNNQPIRIAPPPLPSNEAAASGANTG